MMYGEKLLSHIVVIITHFCAEHMRKYSKRLSIPCHYCILNTIVDEVFKTLFLKKKCKTQERLVEAAAWMERSSPVAKVRMSHNAGALLQSASEKNDELLKDMIVFF